MKGGIISKQMLATSASVAAIGASMLIGLAQPAMAQDKPAAAPAEEQAIVITGSRIARRDYTANSPLVTVGQDVFENRAAPTVEAALNNLPQFATAGSASALTSAATAFSGAREAPGAATLNLRGLGTNRTLVLVNGRRAQPVNALLVVDVNTIPSAAIKNVEVITGGAAAVYGADAIAGVVNFKMRDDFEGIEVNSQFGVAQAGDGFNAQVSGLIGGNFNEGRGNAMFGIVWSDRRAAYQRNRGFYTDAWKDPKTGSAGGGLPITEYVAGGVTYGINFDGSLFNVAKANDPAAPWKGPLNQLAGGSGFNLTNTTGSTNLSLGYTTPNALVNVPLNRYSMYGAAHYDLTDHITFYFEGNYSHSNAYAQSFAGQANSIWSLSVPYNQANDDPASPTFGANKNNFHPVSRQLAAVLNARATVGGVAGTNQNWTLNRGMNFLGELNVTTSSDIFQVTGGFRGSLGIGDWTYDVYGSHGNTSVIARQPSGAVSLPNLQQLITGTDKDYAQNPTTRPVQINGGWSQNWTNGSTFNPMTCTSGIKLFNDDGTVPQPKAGTGEGVTVSDDCKAFVNLELNNITQIDQNVIEGTIQGKLINLWAGEVRFAVGGTYRDDSFNYAPDTGTSGEQTNTSVVNQIALPKPTAGSINVKEVYGELLIPVVKDLPLIEKFELELGGRWSKYNLAGGIGTFKILGDWEVTKWFRLRGGFQLANRAPNIYELFAPVAGAIGASQDACLNLGANTPTWGNRSNPSELVSALGGTASANLNPNIVNLQVACQTLITRDGGYAYRTLKDDPTAVGQAASLYPSLDITRMSNLRDGGVIGYGNNFPFSIALEQGNTALKSEQARTLTLGAVISSPFDTPLLRRLNLTIDYYSVDIKDAIATPNGTEIYSQCLNPLYNPLMASPAGTLTGAQLLAGNPYCALINRFPFDGSGVAGSPGGGAGADRSYKAKYLNKGGTRTQGLDITANWTIPMIGLPGTLNLSATGNILLQYEDQAFPGAAWVSYRGTSQNQAFNYKLSGTTTYAGAKGSIGVRWQYLPRLNPVPTAAAGTNGAAPYWRFDLFGRYQLFDVLEMRAGVDNLFNRRPNIFGRTATNNAGLSTLPVYDTIGRAFYIGAKMRM
jgi:outer membrane receptor protein involved in Fe transport